MQLLMGSPFGAACEVSRAEMSGGTEVEVEVEVGAEVAALVVVQRGAAALPGPPVAVCGK